VCARLAAPVVRVDPLVAALAMAACPPFVAAPAAPAPAPAAAAAAAAAGVVALIFGAGCCSVFGLADLAAASPSNPRRRPPPRPSQRLP